MQNSQKILVCGDVCGKWQSLFKRVESVQKKSGSFDMLLCVGDSFSSDPTEWNVYGSGQEKVPVSTYILGPNLPSHVTYYPDLDGCELADNVTYLGRRGILTTGSGLTLAYVSGMQGPKSNTTFTQEDLQALRTHPTVTDARFKGVDVLMTSQWPAGVDKYGLPVPGGVKTQDNGSVLLAQLTLALRPRYHVAGMEGVFYERQPYRNHAVLQESARHVTRFLGLSRVGNVAKDRFLYAFSLVPMKVLVPSELTHQPQDTTECPYTLDQSEERSRQEKEDRQGQFFYDPNYDPNKHKGKRGGEGRDGPDAKRAPPGPCWFCLGSPEVDKSLVVSVGDHCYVALAKGGLVPDHMMIIPIEHHQSIVIAPDEVVGEVARFKTALRKYYKSVRKVPVFFERNFKTSHLQIQVVPVAGGVAAGVARAFEQTAAVRGLELQELPVHTDLKQVIQPGQPYFTAEIPNGDKYLARCARDFPLQFGREVLCDDSLLNMPERVDWRNCCKDKNQEAEAAQEMRKGFRPFDFNVEDSSSSDSD